MTKPLDLVWHPKPRHYGHANGEWFYGCDACLGRGPNNDPLDKRLTDAELAAESWCATAETADALNDMAVEDDEWRRRLEWSNVVNKFATHPHYDEDQP